jgi:predicted RNA-binding protein with PIN domain
MPARRDLIVDGHSLIFAWPELLKLHRRRSVLAREELIKHLRDYQDWSGVRVVIVFDGKGSKTSVAANPGDVQIFYSPSDQTADGIIELLAGKYARKFDVTVATSDLLERETVTALGAHTISGEMLRPSIGEACGKGSRCQVRGTLDRFEPKDFQAAPTKAGSCRERNWQVARTRASTQ